MNFNITKNKEVRITLGDKTKTFNFKIKRAFTVFTELLKKYPDWMDIHELDGILGDPNRAVSDLKNDEGYLHFLKERRSQNRNNEYLLDLELLFEQYSEESEICLSVAIRQNPTNNLKNILKEKFDNKCNVTGIQLHENLPQKSFLKNLQIIQYDHRVPLFKGGDHNPNTPDNWQLLSELVNREKNKLCNACTSNECNECALAFPENSSIIKANNQDISHLKSSKEG